MEGKDKEIKSEEIIGLLNGAIAIINDYERLTTHLPQVGFEWHALKEKVKLYRKYITDIFGPIPEKE